MTADFRHLPGVDKLLTDARITQAASGLPHDLLVDVIRRVLEQERLSIAAGKSDSSLDDIVKNIITEIKVLTALSLRRVINASGVILHTNLGRAPLSREAMAAMEEVSLGYSNLEFEMESGTRGSRHVHIENILSRLTGAEAGFVVNNNAAAVMLGLSALARRKEVIISRGQAIEIGGGFRIPDVMHQSGARLIEVGTTNRTYARDFEQAIGPRTAALMRVHSSNFRLVGFTSEVTLAELVAIGKKHGILVLDDLGSGCFLDTAQFGLTPEPTVSQSISAGASLVFFSGDKLVGGPQAGIIVGKQAYIEKLKRHPLARALRIDKTRLAALAVTLLHYLKGEALVKVPVWRMIAAPLPDIEKRALAWADAMGGRAKIVPGETMIGGGSLPGGTLPTRLLVLTGAKSRVQDIAARLRHLTMPVIGRIEKDRLLLDPRTVLPEEDEIVINALRELAG